MKDAGLTPQNVSPAFVFLISSHHFTTTVQKHYKIDDIPLTLREICVIIYDGLIVGSNRYT